VYEKGVCGRVGCDVRGGGVWACGVLGAATWHQRFLPSQNKERTKWEERMRVKNAERSRRQEEEVAAAREAEWAEDEEESPPTSEPEPRHSEEL